MKWPFSKKPRTQTLVVPPSRNTKIPAEIVQVSKLRRRSNGVHPPLPPKRGMWVRLGASTGILIDISADDVCRVMLVDSTEGTNVIEMYIHSTELRQAYLEEIPLRRRPEEDVAFALGYVRTP